NACEVIMKSPHTVNENIVNDFREIHLVFDWFSIGSEGIDHND
ncbi:unnamed protein product, partial [marine sediment metagenome]